MNFEYYVITFIKFGQIKRCIALLDNDKFKYDHNYVYDRISDLEFPSEFNESIYYNLVEEAIRLTDLSPENAI